MTAARLKGELARGREDESTGARNLGVRPQALEEREQEGSRLAAARARHGDDVVACEGPRAPRVSRRLSPPSVGPRSVRRSPASASGSVLRWIGVGTRNLWTRGGRATREPGESSQGKRS